MISYVTTTYQTKINKTCIYNQTKRVIQMPTTYDKPKRKTVYDAIKRNERYIKAYDDIIYVIEHAGMAPAEVIGLLEYIKYHVMSGFYTNERYP